MRDKETEEIAETWREEKDGRKGEMEIIKKRRKKTS